MLWMVNSVRMRFIASLGAGVAAVHFREIDRDQAGLPVVEVQHVGPEIEQADASRTARQKKTKRSQLSG